jgi:hypothetical protein
MPRPTRPLPIDRGAYGANIIEDTLCSIISGIQILSYVSVLPQAYTRRRHGHPEDVMSLHA